MTHDTSHTHYRGNVTYALVLRWPNFGLSRARDLDLGSGHIACHHASLVDLYLHTKFH